jgi:hypothetical protein
MSQSTRGNLMHIGTCDICEAKNVELRFTACHGIETWVCDDAALCNGEQFVEQANEHVIEEMRHRLRNSVYINPLAPEKANPYNNVHGKGYVR